MRRNSDQVGRASVWRQTRDHALPVLKSLVLVAITSIGLLVLDQFFALRHVTLVYLVPVIAATKLGIVPAVIAAIAGGGTSAFFFYPPIYSFLVEDPQHLIESRGIWRPISGGRPISPAAVKPKCTTFMR